MIMNNLCVQIAEVKTKDNTDIRITMDYKGWFRCHSVFIGSKIFTDHETVEKLFEHLRRVYSKDNKSVGLLRRQIIDLTSDVDVLEKMRTLLTRPKMSKMRQDVYALTEAR